MKKESKLVKADSRTAARVASNKSKATFIPASKFVLPPGAL
jgi:hypothetical protein